MSAVPSLVNICLLVVVTAAPLHNVSNYDSTCDSIDCTVTANHLLALMNTSVDPCDDFYRFTCGKLLSSGETPVDRDEVIQTDLKKMLEEKTLTKELKCHEQLRKYYSLCKDEETINSQGIGPGVNLLKQMGQWPLMKESWTERNWQFEEAESSLEQFGLGGGLFNIYVSEDDTEIDPANRRYLIHIDLPHSKAGLRKEVACAISQETPCEKIIGIMRTYGKEMNLDSRIISFSIRDVLSTRKSLQEVIDTRTSSDESTDDLDVRRDGTFTIAELQDMFSFIDWRTLLSSIVKSAITLKDEDVVFVVSSKYLQRLGVFLKSLPKQSLANYMMWNAAVKMAPYLSADVSGLTGVPSGEQRWRYCVNKTMQTGLSLALASLLASKHKESITLIRKTTKLATYLQSQLMSDLAKVDWVDESTRKHAQAKIAATKLYIGYPEALFDDDKLESHYKKFDMNTSSYFEASMDNLKWERYQMWRKVLLSVDKYDWRYYDTTNFFKRRALNMESRNAIEVTGPKLIFQDMFNTDVPLYIAYGYIGAIIAPELIHSLDNTGLDYNDKCELKPWVLGGNFDNFTERVKCLKDQYPSFTPTDSTQLEAFEGEIISDNSGLKLAYGAYRKAINHPDLEPGLPHLQDYTPDQLFFITVANYVCADTDNKRIEKMTDSDVRLSATHRVLGMMKNSIHFSQAFNCQRNDRMNPSKKCDVW